MPARSRPSFRAVGALALAGVLAASLAACSSGETAASTSPGSCAALPDGDIKIGSVLPLSGPFAALGAANSAGGKIAVEAFNASNDICGKKLEFVLEDDKGDPATAISLGRKLTGEGVNIFIDAGRGQTGDALTPLLMKDGAIVISDAGFNERFDPANYPTWFGVNPSNDQYMDALFAHLQDKGWTQNVGILNDGLNGGNQYTERLTELFAKAGLPAPQVATYSPTAIDMTPQLQQLKGSGVETLILAGTSGVPAIVQSLKQSGWTPNLGGWGGFFAYAVSPADLPPGTQDLCYVHLAADQAPQGTGGLDPLTLQLLEKAQAELGAGNPGINTAQESYSRLLVAKAAVESAGSLETGALKKAMESLSNVQGAWPGLSFSFSPDSHAGYPTKELKVCNVGLSPLATRYLPTAS